MEKKLREVLDAAERRKVISPSNIPTVELISNISMTVDDAPKIEKFLKYINQELEIEIKVVGGGYGCTKIIITAETASKEETVRILEELFSSDIFAIKAVEVGFDSLLRNEPYIHKTLSSGRILGKLTGEGLPVFLSYANEDDKYRDELEKHLSALIRQNIISAWHDRKLYGGENWDIRIKEQLETTKLFLFLVSADFLASDYCMNIELPYANKRTLDGFSSLVPIIVRPADWEETLLGQYQALPEKAKAVTIWENRDEAWTSVAKGIRRSVRELRQA